MSKHNESGCIIDRHGVCRYQGHREEPNKPVVFQADTQGIWFAQVTDRNGQYRCKVKFTMQAAYAAAAELAAIYGSAA